MSEHYNLGPRTEYQVWTRYADKSGQFTDDSPVVNMRQFSSPDEGVARVQAQEWNADDERLDIPRDRQFFVVKASTTFEEVSS